MSAWTMSFEADEWSVDALITGPDGQVLRLWYSDAGDVTWATSCCGAQPVVSGAESNACLRCNKPVRAPRRSGILSLDSPEAAAQIRPWLEDSLGALEAEVYAQEIIETLTEAFGKHFRKYYELETESADGEAKVWALMLDEARGLEYRSSLSRTP